MWDPKLNLEALHVDETPKAIGIIEFDSLMSVCQIAVHKS